MNHVQRVARAQELRAQGMIYQEIADEMGLARSTVARYITDPDRVKDRARRLRYAGTCIDCGGPTDGSDGWNTPEFGRCMACKTWTEEQIIGAMQLWYDQYGRSPTCTEWRHASSEHPAAGSVLRFGWNVMLRRAGLPVNQNKGPAVGRLIASRIRRGEKTADIAADYGVTPAAIHVRMKTMGTTVGELRGAGR